MEKNKKTIDMKKEILIPNSRRNFIKQSATALAGFIIVPRFVLGGTRPDGTKYIPPSDMGWKIQG
jgi:hypothetical protein